MKEEKSAQPAIDFRLENKLSELEILRQSFEEKKKLADSYYDQLLRLKAEFDNYRKRIEKEKEELVEFGKQELHKQFKQVLEKEGLKKLKVQGEKFDPNLHHAVEYQESDKHKDNEILKEIRPGYLLHERVIRPAMVVVAKAKKQDK